MRYRRKKEPGSSDVIIGRPVGAIPLAERDLPVDMRPRRMTRPGAHPHLQEGDRLSGWVETVQRETAGGRLEPLPYDLLPIDLHPHRIQENRRGPDGQLVPGGPLAEAGRSPMDRYVAQIARDTHELAVTQVLQRGLIGRAVTVGTTPTLLIDARFLRGYIILNPAEATGLTTEATLLASALRTSTGVSSTIGVANFLDQHFFIDVTAVTGVGTLLIVQQALDPVSGNWADVQTLFSIPSTAVATTRYAFSGHTGVAANMRLRWDVGTATNFTFSVGHTLKDGLAGTTAGASQTIYLGNAGVTTTSGFPLLDGQKEKFYLRENTQLFGIATSALTLRIFEL